MIELVGIGVISIIVLIVLRVFLHLRFITAFAATLLFATLLLAVASRSHTGCDHWDNPGLYRIHHALSVFSLVSYLFLIILLITCVIREAHFIKWKPSCVGI
jgi:intracellular septation protein A